MDKLTAKVRSLGSAQAARHILPQLALEVAAAAANREINVDDATELYIDYFRASSGLKNIDPYDNSVKANVSKLRQLIKAADPELLQKVTRQHELLSKQIDVKPLYHAMVEAARYKNTTGKRPTNGHLLRIFKR